MCTAPDGHIYSFPWIEQLGAGKEAIQAIGDIPYINKKWLDYLGLDEQIMTPVILINKEDYGMEELMKNNVNVIEMAAIQKDVMEGKMDPSYY